MFEQIRERVPELRELEDKIQALEQEHQRAQGRVAGLADRVAEVRESDLNNAALALNRQHKPPPPKEGAVREQLEEATRELEILERRLSLATADRAKYIQENSERLAELLSEAQATAGAQVAAGASGVLDDLLALFAVEDDARALGRLAPTPAAENQGPPERVTAIFGPIRQADVGGPRRGDLESALRYLMSLAPATEVGEVDEGAA